MSFANFNRHLSIQQKVRFSLSFNFKIKRNNEKRKLEKTFTRKYIFIEVTRIKERKTSNEAFQKLCFHFILKNNVNINFSLNILSK